MKARYIVSAAPVLLAMVATLSAWTPADDNAPRITVQEFKKLLETDGVLALDVRSASDYTRSHIPGAISVPLDTLTNRVEEFKKSTKLIVAYCS